MTFTDPQAGIAEVVIREAVPSLCIDAVTRTAYFVDGREVTATEFAAYAWRRLCDLEERVRKLEERNG